MRKVSGWLMWGVLCGLPVIRAQAPPCPSYTITTVAGHLPVPEPVSAANLYMQPVALAVDPAGNVYVGDALGNRVFRVTPSGTVRLVAGNGEKGFSGDGGPASSARLGYPSAIALAPNGDIYIADSDSHRVRRVSASTGVISTVAGTGAAGFSGDGGPGVRAQLWGPAGLLVDKNGNLLIGDKGNFRVRLLTAAGEIRTFAGSGYPGDWADNVRATDAGLHKPEKLAMDAWGAIYVLTGAAEFGAESAVRRIDTNGIISTIRKLSGFSYFSRFAGLAVDPSGAILAGEYSGISPAEYAERTDHYRVVLRLSASGEAAIAGSKLLRGGARAGGFSGDGGPATAALFTVADLAADGSGNLFIADHSNYRVRRVDSSGVISTFAGTESNIGPAHRLTLDGAQFLAAAADGTLFFSTPGFVANGLKYGGSRIRRISPAGAVSTVFAPGLSRDEGGKIVTTAAGDLSFLSAAANGDVFTGTSVRGPVFRISPNMVAASIGGQQGAPLAVWGGGTDAAGNGYVLEGPAWCSRLLRITPAGTVEWVAGRDPQPGENTATSFTVGSGAPAKETRLHLVSRVTGDASGALYLAATGAAYKVDAAGRISVLPASLYLNNAAADRWGNLFYIPSGRLWSESSHTIKMLTPAGADCLVAGAGRAGFGGDGGPASQALLSSPDDIATGPGGAVYFHDRGNGRIRRLAPRPVLFEGHSRNLAGLAVSAAAPGQVLTLRGAALSASIAKADSAAWPESLAGVSVVLRSADGGARALAVGRVAWDEVDVLIPEGIAEGVARIIVRSPAFEAPLTMSLTIKPLAPALLTADGFHPGAALGSFERTLAGGSRAAQPTYRCAGDPKRCAPIRVDFGARPGEATLHLAATGVRNHGGLESVRVRTGGLDAPVLAVEPVAEMPGLDLLSVSVDPAALYASDVEVEAAVGDVRSNKVLVNFGSSAVAPMAGSPTTLTVGPGDELFVARFDSGDVVKITPDGFLEKVAGLTGATGYDGDGGLADLAIFNVPIGLALDPGGRLYISDSANALVRVVSENRVTAFAGAGSPGYAGDGGPAGRARLNYPYGLAFHPDGSLYVADRINHRIRRIGPDGLISTVAGSGSPGFSGDGGPATSARLNEPKGIWIDSRGVLFIADSANAAVRRVDLEGRIHTVAGTGVRGLSGAGGPAESAQINHPNAVTGDAAGNLYIVDALNHCVFKVSAEGVITMVAGNGTRGFSGDGGPAAEAQLSAPRGIAFDSEGNMLIADTENKRIRKVGRDGIISTYAGGGEP